MLTVSVVVPTYNTIDYLPDAIDSILKQTFENFELLLVNDGSTDTTAQWVESLTDPRIRYIYQDNQGLSTARNTGINLAQGRYIALLDADDLWEPTKLEKQVACLDANPDVGMVHTWVSFMDGQGRSTGRIWKTYAEGMAFPRLLHRNDVAVLSVLVRRECFAKVGGFDPSLRSLEDWDMWLRLSVHYSIAVIKEPLARYRQLPGSMSRNCEVMENSFKRVIDRHFDLAPENLQYLRARSYGSAYQCLAWKSIQGDRPDVALAWVYYQSALRFYPRMLLTLDALKLLLAIQMQKQLKPSGYNRLLGKFYALRRLMLVR